MPGGGIKPARSFEITRSHTSAWAPGLPGSKLSSASPAVSRVWLWQMTQYWSRNARGSAAGEVWALDRTVIAAAPARRRAQRDARAARRRRLDPCRASSSKDSTSPPTGRISPAALGQVQYTPRGVLGGRDVAAGPRGHGLEG